MAFLVKADQDANPYPDIDDFQYVNYAESGNQQQVIYDYVDHSGHDNDELDNGNRYYVDEKAPNEYDYSSDDYSKVGEGTKGNYEKLGDWHYEEPSHDSYA